jgi:hypothetical protein
VLPIGLNFCSKDFIFVVLEQNKKNQSEAIRKIVKLKAKHKSELVASMPDKPLKIC